MPIKKILQGSYSSLTFYRLYLRWENQPVASEAVTDLKAIVTAKINSSFVRALSFHKTDFTFDHDGSIGLKSGLYGGKNTTITPFSIKGYNVPLTLCEDKLSNINVSPAFIAGAND